MENNPLHSHKICFIDDRDDGDDDVILCAYTTAFMLEYVHACLPAFGFNLVW
jgi:hypothetical protein